MECATCVFVQIQWMRDLTEDEMHDRLAELGLG